MNEDVYCPYCNKGQEVNHDDGYGYEEDRLHQQECEFCNKVFTYNTSISYYYEAYKADCLNGAEHNFKKISRYPLVIFGKVSVRCRTCEEEKDIPYTEAHLYGYNQDEVNEAFLDKRYNKEVTDENSR